ncbi:S8 family peptidase [Aquipuribacter hungaricus]|uniref:S8 family peptidase n=2 Tax=Aquipuribacter hungaricus TaxID=545624 RepID=A0ABV7WKX3_9MICO
MVVFDLAGSVEAFAHAVRRVPGLEFLAELDEGKADPDDDFHVVDSNGQPTDDKLDETAYLVLTNTQAVTQLVKLFQDWQADETMRFPYGLTPLRNAFRLLRDLRRWSPQDRVRDTGLLEQWQEEVAVVGNSGSARVEVELWFRNDPVRRAAAQAQVSGLIAAAGGQVRGSSALAEIGYHAVLADVPHAQIQQVLDQGPGAIELLRANDVMLVSPATAMSVVRSDDVADGELADRQADPPTEPPLVALLDAVPLANHELLAGRLVLDDPDGVGALYPSASQQRHGTAMASLIAHGDLNDPGPPLPSRLYVRPVLGPHPFYDNIERVPEGELLVDLIHRAFQRMFKGEGQQAAAAPSVRIVNLSIGDPARIFVRRMSPLAKLLDWLAYTYNLLILVSVGNHDTRTTVPAELLDKPTELSRHLLANNRDNALRRRLMSPAEAVNVLTVGATHADSWSGTVPDTVLDAAEPHLPAPYGGGGLGHRRSVKPDILLPGGRRLFQRPVPGRTGDVELRPASTEATGPGQRVAAPDRRGGAAATAFTHGTSNATALATRASALVMHQLNTDPSHEGDHPFPDPQYHPVLTKALLVHAASWGDAFTILQQRLDSDLTRLDGTQLLGYGLLHSDRLAVADRGRATLLGAGTITGDQRHTYRYPLPPGLRATTDWRRLTITLAWLSPVNTRTQLHRSARLRVEPPTDELHLQRMQADPNGVRRGTVQHELLDGRRAAVYADDAHLALNVDCRLDNRAAPGTPVRYGLVVSLEVGVNVRTDVHAEVRQQLRTRIQTLTRVQPAS